MNIDIERSIATQIARQLIISTRESVRMVEVDSVLRDYLHNSRKVDLMEGAPGYWGVLPVGNAESLFESVSYAACLEFALKLPIIEK